MSLEQARRDLEQAALQFARVLTMDRYLDGPEDSPSWVLYSSSDREAYVKTFRGRLENMAVRLLAETTAIPLPERETER